MRRVKKTTNEQFDLLKAEMAVHPAAARGYGVGAQRAIVDAEWKDIVEKLNALGPPERTMTEWKKVWSDVRLRMKKQNMGKIKRAKKIKMKKLKRESVDPAEDRLMESLNSSISIYQTHIKSEHGDEDRNQETLRDFDDYEDEDSHVIENNLYENEECKLNNTQTSQSHDNMEQTLDSLQKQLQIQNGLLNNLLQTSSNMTLLMQRFMKAEEKKTSIMQRQMKINEYHNVFLRRQEARQTSKFINLQIE